MLLCLSIISGNLFHTFKIVNNLIVFFSIFQYPIYSINFLMYALFIFSSNMELFIYCWAGTLVTNEVIQKDLYKYLKNNINLIT